MSDTFTVQRSIVIAAPPDHVYRHLVDFREWAAWSPWEGMDPSMQKSYGGPETGVGSTSAWSGNRKVGQGRMEITSAQAPSEVAVDLEFIKPFKAKNAAVFSLEPVDDGTSVTWTMTGPMTLLLRVIGVVRSMDKMIGPDFEKGLAQLKTVVEGET